MAVSAAALDPSKTLGADFSALRRGPTGLHFWLPNSGRKENDGVSRSPSQAVEVAFGIHIATRKMLRFSIYFGFEKARKNAKYATYYIT